MSSFTHRPVATGAGAGMNCGVVVATPPDVLGPDGGAGRIKSFSSETIQYQPIFQKESEEA